MSLVLPILFFCIAIGLFVPKITVQVWLLVAAWILIVMVYNYNKPTAVPIPTQGPYGLFRSTDDFAARQA